MRMRIGLGASLVVTACAISAQFAKPHISFKAVAGVREIQVPPYPVDAYRVTDRLQVYALFTQQWNVQQISIDTGEIRNIQLGTVPEKTRAERFHVLGDLDVDASGSLYLPIIWRNSARDTFSGIAVFNDQGQHTKTITLKPAVNIRHIVRSDSGEFFVLGLDPDYAAKKLTRCSLVHKYGIDGRRIMSFSDCPIELLSENAADRSAQALERMLEEIDRGRLWFCGDSLCQLLPISKSIRKFNADGSIATQTRFTPPTSASTMVWNAFALGKDTYLVDWVEEARTDKGHLRSRGISIHRSAGSAVSAISRPNEVLGLPIACMENVGCLLITRPTKSTRILTRAQIELR